MLGGLQEIAGRRAEQPAHVRFGFPTRSKRSCECHPELVLGESFAFRVGKRQQQASHPRFVVAKPTEVVVHRLIDSRRRFPSRLYNVDQWALNQ
jgi:hypothetical protein